MNLLNIIILLSRAELTVKELIKEDFIVPHPTSYGMQIALDSVVPIGMRRNAQGGKVSR